MVAICLLLVFLVFNCSIFPISGLDTNGFSDVNSEIDKRELKLNGKIMEGATIKCDQDQSGRMYRYSNGLRRLYPSDDVQLFWADASMIAQTVDCSSIGEGVAMTLTDS